ncbi:MAG: SGNH/GDSL hydrolase family protein [Pseudanabaenales cyanobacterium]|nr:SGNH/GDSL hydrolase family protein [Pseudanabaenales cyanobacterium]
MKPFAKYWIPGFAIATFITAEGLLRLGFGLGNPILVQADPETGYHFQPNQKITRFGRKVEYNQYSQRSEQVTGDKPQGIVRILMTGDSVLNGGSPTDQTQTISELLEAKIQNAGVSVEVLNASAGSWGIGNQLGYLRKFGAFASDVVILQIGAHDLLQSTSTGNVVGHHPGYPDQAPLLAIQEVITRYIWPRASRLFQLSSPPSQDVSADPNQIFQNNMADLATIITLVRTERIPILVLFTPNRTDLIPTPSMPKQKLAFLQRLNALEVPVIDTHSVWSTLPTATSETFFRDAMHLSIVGNQAVADLLFQELCVDRPGCKNLQDGVAPLP